MSTSWSDTALEGFGSPAPGFRIPAPGNRPVVLLTTNGPGPKLDVALHAGRLDNVGHDLVAVVVDNLASMGARPAAIRAHLSIDSLDTADRRGIADDIAAACQSVGCAYLGASQAAAGPRRSANLDLMATAVGIAQEDALVDPADLKPGDVVIGMRSSNVRTSGFDRVWEAVQGADLVEPMPDSSQTVAEALLEGATVYSPAVIPAIEIGAVHGLAHIDEQGLTTRLASILPIGASAHLEASAWDIPHVFSWLQDRLSATKAEMYRDFNMGIGYVVVDDAEYAEAVLAVINEYDRPSTIIGEIVPGDGSVEVSDSAPNR